MPGAIERECQRRMVPAQDKMRKPGTEEARNGKTIVSFLHSYFPGFLISPKSQQIEGTMVKPQSKLSKGL